MTLPVPVKKPEWPRWIPTPVRQFCSARVRDKGLFGQFLRRMRRFWFGAYHADYIEYSIKTTREGDCHRCGACCELLYKCPMLGRDGQNLPYCRIYGDLRPVNCHMYPFDEIDSEIDKCGFKFPKKKTS